MLLHLKSYCSALAPKIWLSTNSRLHQCLKADGEFADADAGGVVNGGGDGGSYACEADFADAAGAVFAEDGVGIVEEVDIDGG